MFDIIVTFNEFIPDLYIQRGQRFILVKVHRPTEKSNITAAVIAGSRNNPLSRVLIKIGIVCILLYSSELSGLTSFGNS